jgi:hypothetical protein
MTESDRAGTVEGPGPQECSCEPSCARAGATHSNLAVPLGALFVLISFFLPWINLGPAEVSGFDLAFRPEAAGALLDRFGVYTREPTTVTRPLMLVPLMAIGVLMLNLTAGKRLIMRLVTRSLIMVTGLMITAGFGFVGSMVVNVRPGPALWTTFSGGLLIVLGTVYDVARGE